MKVYVLKANFHVDQNFVFEDLDLLLDHIRQDLIDAEADPDTDWTYTVGIVEMTQEEIDALPEY